LNIENAPRLIRFKQERLSISEDVFIGTRKGVPWWLLSDLSRAFPSKG
jgi:hypothetical protein